MKVLTCKNYTIKSKDGKFVINAEIYQTGLLTIKPFNKMGEYFYFLNSRPHIVKNVAKLLLEASEIKFKGD